MFNVILVRYGELSTKGRNRPQFIKCLLENIKKSLKKYQNLKYEKTRHFIIINLNEHHDDITEINSILKCIFGISSFSLAVVVHGDLDEIAAECINVINYFQPLTFKIEAKRSDKSYKYSSSEFKKIIAEKILNKYKFEVDLINPELTITIEIKKDIFYLVTSRIIGAKGYPVGIAGKVLLLLSGGIDSPVSAYLLMKRGLEVHYLHFYTPPHTSEQSWTKVLSLTKILKRYQPVPTKIYRYNFTPLQNEIGHIKLSSYRITIMRRLFIRLACKIAKDNDILVLATGESVGQVASQTIESLNTINNVSDLVILRPLITYDKEEVIKLAKDIKTFEISILQHDDCCSLFVPKNPVTKPRISKAEALENEIFINELLENDILPIEIFNV